MFYFIILIVCSFSLPQGNAEPRTATRRYKPIIQVTEEIDINDITFTTSAPEYDRSTSHKTANYYSGSSYNAIPDTSLSVYPRVSYKDGYVGVVPLEKIYPTKQPIVVPPVKYKPYKVYKVQDDGFRPGGYKPSAANKGKVVVFEPPPTFSAIGSSETPGKYSSKIVPFSSQYLPTKAPTRASNYLTSENRKFIPSPTFSPTVLAQITNDNTQKYSDLPEKDPEWEKPTKKPIHIKKAKKTHENHDSASGGASAEDYSGGSEQSPAALYRDSPQSESFLSEISTVHKGGAGSPDNLDGVADSLDLKTGERVEFQMYGMDGPKSYKFGYDTGKGNNRHFRFEERDNTGKVKGHYGYLDEDGKMRIMKYEADPITGFHAGPVEIADDN